MDSELIPQDLRELYADCLADDSRLSRITTNGFMAQLIERTSAAERERAELRERYAFAENQRLCVGDAGGCDGDLTATEHEEDCPARAMDVELRPYLYPSRARSAPDAAEKGNADEQPQPAGTGEAAHD